VEDARDLREKAFFSPVSSRYKVYVIDEAHMVSPQGFNALLKLVEEPPPHLKFVFATTEPDKVIGTIRSRTHHYPFRLVPPRLLTDYLATLCEREGVTIDSTALPLVVRAGGGSVRDALSVLDQLIGGSAAAGVTYQLAASLLGYTPDSLLDDVVDAFAAGDGASVFAAVDKVIESGQEPRRFAEDLLQRLRDLIIVSAVPGAVQMGLLDAPPDTAARLESQAALLGPAELTRAAEVVSKGLDEIRGATAPRLLLELICARVLLPGADHGTEGVLARLDRLERRLTIAGGAPSTAANAAVEERVHEHEPPLAGAPQAPSALVRPAGEERSAEQQPDAPAVQPPPVAAPPAHDTHIGEPATPPPSAAPAAPAAELSAAGAGLSLVDVRRLWPDVLDAVKRMRRFAWVMLSQNASVHSLDGATLTIALVNGGARDAFARSGSDEIVRQALIDKLGVDWRVEAIVDPSAATGTAQPSASVPRSAGGDSEAPSGAGTTGATALPEQPARAAANAETTAAARDAIRPTRRGGDGAASARESDSAVHRDDPPADGESVSSDELLARELGAEVIEVIEHDD
jgi:DNA polymerase-3 subunit gamma/tau